MNKANFKCLMSVAVALWIPQKLKKYFSSTQKVLFS